MVKSYTSYLGLSHLKGILHTAFQTLEGRIDGRMDGRIESLLPFKNTKDSLQTQVEQGKVTADHLMP